MRKLFLIEQQLPPVFWVRQNPQLPDVGMHLVTWIVSGRFALALQGGWIHVEIANEIWEYSEDRKNWKKFYEEFPE
jgi:hypothetical protein